MSYVLGKSKGGAVKLLRLLFGDTDEEGIDRVFHYFTLCFLSIVGVSFVVYLTVLVVRGV